jgi:hypothetical protein
VWVAPFATHAFQGAGVEAGYRWRWLAGMYRFGFVQNGYAPAEGTPFLRETQRMFLDLELDGELHLPKRLTLAGGAGVGLLDDRIATSEETDLGWATSSRRDFHARPLVNVAVLGPLFEAAVTFYVGDNAEARLSVGVIVGRVRHR